MKVLTLTQPWASLMALGPKRVETRSWRTEYRGPLLIHAAKGFPDEARRLFYEPPFVHDLRAGGYDLPSDLPRGVILAQVTLVEVVPTEWLLHDHGDQASRLRTEYFGELSNEERYGNYSNGRWAWITRNRRTTKHVEARGALNIWNFAMPPEAVL